MLSINTDYIADTGPPDEYLRQIAMAGFTHVHWCHHWNTDFIYTDPEIEDIARQLADNELTLLDTHGSEGVEKCWYSSIESQRRAGVELVKNRVDFTRRLGGDCVVMHATSPARSLGHFEAETVALYKSLDDLEPFCRDRGITLALENLNRRTADLEFLLSVIESHSRDFLGFCYDSGHHHIRVDGEPDGTNRPDDLRQRLGRRLFAVHLHDNDASGDQHCTPFEGTIDWNNIIEFIKGAGFTKPLILELACPAAEKASPGHFLNRARLAELRLTKMLHPLK